MIVYTLYRVEQAGKRVTRMPLSEHDSLRVGLSAGQRACHREPKVAFALYRASEANGNGSGPETRVARFGWSRLATEVELPAAGLLGEIIS